MRSVSIVILGALAAIGSADSKVVLGRLGQTKTAAQIYSAPSSKAKAISRVEKGRYLVVRPSGDKWSVVVMDNGRLAYIPAQTVDVLAFEVTSDGARPMAGASRRGAGYVASRGGGRPLASSDKRADLAVYAQQFEGTTPYKWGGNEIGSGIDCSGFVKKMYGAINVNLPRTAAEQALVGQPITRYEELRPGDRLYFWDAKRGKIGHTGIYLGGDKQGRPWFVHSSSGHKGIAKDILSARWQKICVAARR